MKKLVIIAMLIAMVSPAMALQHDAGAAPSGTIPVKMTIDRFAEIFLPDEVILFPDDATVMDSDWHNDGGNSIWLRSNFNCTVLADIVALPGFETLGLFQVGLGPVGNGLSNPSGLGPVASIDYDPAAPSDLTEIQLGVKLSNVDLTAAQFTPAQVTVAEIDITVTSQ